MPTEEMDADDSPLIDLDPRKPWFVSAWGKKGSGKSVINREIFRSYPGDKIAIDINGNADPGEDAEKITRDQLGGKFPAPADTVGERRRARTLWFRAHPGAATFREDLDRAVALALYPQDHPACVWAGEVGELTPNGRAGSHMQTVLMQNRHYNVTALFDGPRPVHVPPLVLSQSNLVAVFRLPNPNDRKRIAEEIGFPPKEFDRECFKTWRRGPHHFVLWDADADQLYRHEPIPLADEPKAAA